MRHLKPSIYSLLILFSFIGCNQEKTTFQINEDKLLEYLQYLASDALEGRGFSKPGNYKAQEYIAKKFKELALEEVLSQGYIQKFPYTFKGQRRQRMFPVKIFLTLL